MNTSAIEKEVGQYTKVKPKKGEDRQEYLHRFTQKLDDLTDNEWENMSKPAQDWANAAAKAVTDDKPVPDFPDADEDEESEDESEGDDTDAEDKAPATKAKANGKKSPVKAKGKPKVDKSAKATKPAKPAKAPKEPKEKTRGGPTGVKVRIKKLIVRQPKITVEQLMEALMKDGGPAPSQFTVSNIRAEFRHSIKVLEELDLLTKKLDV